MEDFVSLLGWCGQLGRNWSRIITSGMFHCFLLSFSGIEIHLSASVNDLMVCVCVEEVKNMQSTSGESFSVQPLSYCKIVNVMCEINQKMTTPAEWWVLVLQNVTWTRDSEVTKLRCWSICLILTILLILCWVNETGCFYETTHSLSFLYYYCSLYCSVSWLNICIFCLGSLPLTKSTVLLTHIEITAFMGLFTPGHFIGFLWSDSYLIMKRPGVPPFRNTQTHQQQNTSKA